MIRALALGLVLALAGCQTSPTPAPVAGQAPDPAVEARKAFERHDWVAAAPLFRHALTRDPNNLWLHYSLAIVATQLDARDEARREFQWVLANAAPDSEEARVARGWLGEAGGPTAAKSSAEVVDETRGDSRVTGMVTLPSDSTRSVGRMQIYLKGIPGTSTHYLGYTVRTDEVGRFEFKNIVAGVYKLTDGGAAPPTWRLKVDLEPGRESVIDLTPNNTVQRRDDFPQG